MSTPETRKVRLEEFQRAEAALRLARHRKWLEDSDPVNCPGCAIPIRILSTTPFTDKRNWCKACGGTAPPASVDDGDTVEVFAMLLELAIQGEARAMDGYVTGQPLPYNPMHEELLEAVRQVLREHRKNVTVDT